MSRIEVRLVGESAAAGVLGVIGAAFGARPPLDPPAAALSETRESVARQLAAEGGLLAERDGRPVGASLFGDRGRALALRRFGVVPGHQGDGIAGALLAAAEEHAHERGYAGLRVIARIELEHSIRFWEHHGFVRGSREGHNLHLARLFPRHLRLPTACSTRELGERLGRLLRAGDLVVLSGDLGAGKTTLTQGLGAGLGVRGDVTSPTFVIARVHPSQDAGPELVHVDAYRLGGIAELDDLDLDTSLEDAVTVVEWGEGVAEALADDRLELRLARPRGDLPSSDGDSGEPAEEPREATLQPIGLRWFDTDLGSL